MVALGNMESQQGNKGQARRWWEQAAATGHADAAPRAMINLGVLDQELGNEEGARLQERITCIRTPRWRNEVASRCPGCQAKESQPSGHAVRIRLTKHVVICVH